MSIERHSVTVRIGMSQDEEICQHFGESGQPENARIVVRKYATIAPRPPRKVKAERQQW